MELAKKKKFIADFLNKCFPDILGPKGTCRSRLFFWSNLAICYERYCDSGVDGCSHRFCYQCLENYLKLVLLIFVLLK